MRKTIQSKIIVFFLLAAVFGFCKMAQAAYVPVSSRIALYGEAKYEPEFTHFEYANPQAPKGGKIVMPEYGGFDNFNPFIFKGIPASSAAALTLDSLGTSPVDDVSTVYPLIAKAFELPKDKSFVGFIIDERAKFSDGSPVTADDVIFSFNALIEKGSPLYKVYYADVEKAIKLNDRHVRFLFKKGIYNRELPLILSQIKIFSAKDWENKDFSKPSLTPPLGSGPYIIDRFEPGKYIVLKRNPDYWAKDLPVNKGFYNFDEIRQDYYQDTTVTLQALFSGNIDLREEYISKIWVTGYDNDIVKSGKIIKEEMPHNQPAILQNFAFNIRRNKFKDKRVREAIGLAFNFDWANDKLFYNQYQRIYSYFTNTGMEATGLPKGKELQILNKFKDRLDKSVFEKAPALPGHKDYMETRQNLRKAVALLKDAGYDFKDGIMTHQQTGEALEFEVLSNSANGSAFTRVMLPFIDNLKKIGIKATFRNIEVSVFKNRLDNFDFDMAIISYGVSPMPGNEQFEIWGSNAADVRGSNNVIGIKNPVVDELIKGIVQSEHKDDYTAYVRALDRVLLDEHYIIPQWYSPYKRVAYRNKFGHPETSLNVGFQPHTWWIKQNQEAGSK